MELGHILRPSDPVTRESSDPETQLTLFYNELQNYVDSAVCCASCVDNTMNTICCSSLMICFRLAKNLTFLVSRKLYIPQGGKAVLLFC